LKHSTGFLYAAGTVAASAAVIAGVVVGVAGQAFSSGVAGQITFGVSLGVLALAGVAQLDPVVAVSTGATAGIGPGRSRPHRRSS
jgi:hypothetical protein